MENQHRDRPIKVGLVQINNTFSGKSYLPLSIGMLQAYAQKALKNPQDFEFMSPVFTRMKVDEAVEQLEDARVVGFSNYVWNNKISHAIAQKLKKRKPEILIAFGGPHVPDRLERGKFFDSTRVENYLRAHPYIDIACHGEGEPIFLALLENFTDDRLKIPSISFIDPNSGRFIETIRSDRTVALDQFPSPFLEGIFEQLMRENPHQGWIVMWETNRGCPFSCTFCDWGGAVLAKVNKFGMERIYREVDWFFDHKIHYVMCADANFGIFSRDLDIARYMASKRIQTGVPLFVSIQSTKNAQERSYLVQKEFAMAGMNTTIILSRQSMDPGTLSDIKRTNISNEIYSNLQKKFNADRIETLTDIILPLPGETYASFVKGVDELLGLGQHNRINFNNLSILPNAEMGDPEYQKKYGMETVITGVVNTHGFLPDNDEIMEEQELVVSTSTASREDWRRMRAFGWMVSFLHFDKIFQVPIINLHHLTNIPYGEILELFSEGIYNQLAPTGKFPTLDEIRQFFLDKALDMQNGGYEFPHSKEWLNIFWHPDEYMLIKLATENRLSAFYEEALMALTLLVQTKHLEPSFDFSLLSNAVQLNEALIKMPFQTNNMELETSYNTYELYRSVVMDNPIALDQTPHIYWINRTKETWDSWSEWLEKVIWYGYRRGAYWYGNVNTEISLAGHY